MSAPVGGLFPPEDSARASVLDVLHQSPTVWGHRRTRWTLALLRGTCLALARLSLSGVWRRLARWQIGHKRSRDRLVSPDPTYREKVAQITAACAHARATPATHVVLYADEFSYYRQPAPGGAYWEQGAGGHHQPLGFRSHRSNTKRRVLGAVQAHTGQVDWLTASKIGLANLKKFLRQVRSRYGPDVNLTLVWDNWPVHAHDAVLAVAAAERITVLWLPTYAPWLNPIEKLWHWLKAEVIRLHPWSDRWEQLHTEVATFLNEFAGPSPALLRYIGLAPPE